MEYVLHRIVRRQNAKGMERILQPCMPAELRFACTNHPKPYRIGSSKVPELSSINTYPLSSSLGKSHMANQLRLFHIYKATSMRQHAQQYVADAMAAAMRHDFIQQSRRQWRLPLPNPQQVSSERKRNRPPRIVGMHCCWQTGPSD